MYERATYEYHRGMRILRCAKAIGATFTPIAVLQSASSADLPTRRVVVFDQHSVRHNVVVVTNKCLVPRRAALERQLDGHRLLMHANECHTYLSSRNVIVRLFLYMTGTDGRTDPRFVPSRLITTIHIHEVHTIYANMCACVLVCNIDKHSALMPYKYSNQQYHVIGSACQ